MAMGIHAFNFSKPQENTTQPLFLQESLRVEKDLESPSCSSFQEALKKASHQIQELDKKQETNVAENQEQQTFFDRSQKEEKGKVEKNLPFNQDQEKPVLQTSSHLKKASISHHNNHKNKELEQKLQGLMQKINIFLNSLKTNQLSSKDTPIQTEKPLKITQENFLAVQEKLLALINQLLSQNNHSTSLQKLNPKQIQVLEGFKNQLQELNQVFLKKLDLEPLKVLSGLDLATQNIGNTLKQSMVKDEKRIYDIRFEKGFQSQSKKASNMALKTENQENPVFQTSGSALGKVLQQELQTDKNQPLLTTLKNPQQDKNQKTLKNSEILKNTDKPFDAHLVLKNQEVSLKENLSFNNASKTQTISKADLGKHILNQIGEKVQGFIGKNFSHISMDLKPEHLGSLKIILDMKNEVLKGRIVVENAQVKEVVQEQIQQIKSILEGSGIQLDNLEVSTRQENNAGQQQQENQKLQDAITQGYKAHVKDQEIDATKSYEKVLEDTFSFSNEFSNRVFITV